MDELTGRPAGGVTPAQSVQRLIAIADAVANHTDIGDALESLAADCSRAFGARVAIFEQAAHGWTLVGRSPGRFRTSLADLDRALTSLPPDAVTTIDLRGEGVWTALAVAQSGEWLIRILLAGDWRAFGGELTSFATLLAFALRCARERAGRVRMERLVLGGYRVGRNLSRRTDFSATCQRLVDDLSRELAADRVALALYRPAVDRLVIAATHGYPAASVKDVRIEPGSWVVGHVYTTGRPVFVRDIAQLRNNPATPRHYRTSSFVAVPMFSGTETIGVLSATDKRDGSPFERADALALRSFASTAALAIAAARSADEANRLSYAATADSVTALFNRSYFDTRLHQELERARRAGTPLTVLLLDIDDFKKINDTYGHPFGDAILHAVGEILRSTVRVFDICARFGGDEFAILMPTTDHARATASAERIRKRVATNTSFPSGPRLTVSIGVAVSSEDDTPADLVRRADRLLYQAKEQGKNRVCANADDAVMDPMPPDHDNHAEPV
jgi:diguanylate cyclase (GGDEF)-like protein